MLQIRNVDKWKHFIVYTNIQTLAGIWKSVNPGAKTPATLLTEKPKHTETDPFKLFEKVARLHKLVDMLVSGSEVKGV